MSTESIVDPLHDGIISNVPHHALIPAADVYRLPQMPQFVSCQHIEPHDIDHPCTRIQISDLVRVSSLPIDSNSRLDPLASTSEQNTLEISMEPMMRKLSCKEFRSSELRM